MNIRALFFATALFFTWSFATLADSWYESIPVDKKNRMNEFLGEHATPYLIAKSLTCAYKGKIPNLKYMEKIFSQNGYTLAEENTWRTCDGYRNDNCLEVRIQDANGVTTEIDFGSNGTVFIRSDGKLVIKDTDIYNPGNNKDFNTKECVPAWLERFEYDEMNGLLTKISVLSHDFTVEEDRDNQAVTPLEDIYKDCKLENPELQTVMELASDTNKVIIAVMDNGININNPDLANKIDRKLVGYDFVGYIHPYDKNERDHGTKVAKIAIKNVDNVQLVPIEIPLSSGVLEDLIKPQVGLRQPDGFEKAVKYASQRGVKVLNMSFGANPNSPDASNYCKTILAHPEILFVHSAGNENINLNKATGFSAECLSPNLLRVGAVDDKGKLTNFSNFGKSVDLGALGIVEMEDGKNKKKIKGTSFSAPAVTRTATKMLLIDPSLKPEKIIEIIKKTVTKKLMLMGKFESGGYLNEEKALAETHKQLKEKSKSDR